MTTTPAHPVLNASAAATMSTEAFERHRRAEVARREEFANVYPAIAVEIDKTIVKNAEQTGHNVAEIIIPVQGRNEEEDEKLAEVRKVHKRMAEVGTIPATIVNLLPFDFQAQGRYLMYEDMRIHACPIGQAFELKLIDSYKVDLEDKGGRFGADVITPIQLAKDIVRQTEAQKRGGLFFYIGNHRPGEKLETRDRELKDWDKAKKSMIAYFKNKYREADGYYQQSSKIGLRNIVEEHRQIAHWLHFFRFITTLPAWVSATREAADVPDTCPNCGAEVGSGFSCAPCGYIIDPYRAYVDGEIEDDHHSLRRLTRQQLDTLDLEYVMTKDEYRAMRKKEAHGEEEVDSDSPRRRPAKKKGKGKAKAAEEDQGEVAGG